MEVSVVELVGCWVLGEYRKNWRKELVVFSFMDLV